MGAAGDRAVCVPRSNHRISIRLLMVWILVPQNAPGCMRGPHKARGADGVGGMSTMVMMSMLGTVAGRQTIDKSTVASKGTVGRC